ncbi:hypothetical protein SS50377_22249 [Spironucleus salmonicida]|uniref:Uncharacterized protein n=1 Tax=Spironucleus salmonicida TaxID=348837 RepID=V6LDE1_9EUKA|nr:hypothetical protein SS50377_22249 [Spironucleus salmonicida]|eukprot:EST42258.1 Hypothetical protein SS50377_18558 [Spironucleus salmonicida]
MESVNNGCVNEDHLKQYCQQLPDKQLLNIGSTTCPTIEEYHQSSKQSEINMPSTQVLQQIEPQFTSYQTFSDQDQQDITTHDSIGLKSPVPYIHPNQQIQFQPDQNVQNNSIKPSTIQQIQLKSFHQTHQIQISELMKLNKIRAAQLKKQGFQREQEIAEWERLDAENNIHQLQNKRLNQLIEREKQLEKLRLQAIERKEKLTKIKQIRIPEITLENLRKPNPKIQLANKFFPKPLNRMQICKENDEIFYGKTVIQNKINQERKDYIGIKNRERKTKLQVFSLE